jgi:hypothetical protein
VPTEKSVVVAVVDVAADDGYAFGAMMSVLLSLVRTLGTLARSRSALQLEILALPAPTGGAAAHPITAGAAREEGPVPLGPARPRLDRMANGARDRQAGDRHRLAPTGLPAVVDLEESPPHGATHIGQIVARRRAMATSWRSPRSAASTIDTSGAQPERLVAPPIRRARAGARPADTPGCNAAHQPSDLP